jgi:hypothetical protein
MGGKGFHSGIKDCPATGKRAFRHGAFFAVVIKY